MKQTKIIIKYAPFVFNQPTDTVCEEVIRLDDLKEQRAKEFLANPIKRLYDDLINNIDNIYPSTTLILGINNKQRFVSCQSLLDYIENKYLKSSKPSLNNDFKKESPNEKFNEYLDDKRKRKQIGEHQDIIGNPIIKS
jgi:hypothetical protein